MNVRHLPCIACAASSLLVVQPALAQNGEEEDRTPGPWSYGAILGLNLSQSSFSENWSGGDQGSISWVLKSDLGAERQFSRSFHVDNDLQLAFGQTAEQTSDASGDRKWSSPQKTTDLVQLESLGRFTVDSWVDPYAAFRLDSQFLDERDPFDRSLLFNPVRLKESGGVARVFVKEEKRELISRVGFGFRQNFTRFFTDATGAADATESFSTTDGGLEFQTDGKAPFADGRLLYKGKLLVFFPFFYSRSGELEAYDALALAADPGHEAVADFWKKPDVNFQNTVDAKVTEWMSVSLYLQLIYDKFDSATNVDSTKPLADVQAAVNAGIRKAGQFKQTLALALSFQLI